jgi:DNA-binding transcriptional LysR family regulator
MDRFAAMSTFVAIVDAGSLSAAARRLESSAAAVSRQLSALEEELGARLINRTTRRLTLTEGGRSYYERCKRILGDLDEAEAELSEHQVAPAGRLVVSAPVPFGSRFLAPVLADFMRQYPQVDIDLSLTDRFVSLVEEGFDVALRIGPLGDSTLIARRLGSFRRVVCGAPAYLAKLGEPKEPADLARYKCLIFTRLFDAYDWHFAKDGREIPVRVSGSLRTDSMDVVLQAALDGAGLCLANSWQLREHVAAGRLKVLLRDYELPEVPINIVYPHARLLSAKVRAFIEFMVERCAKEDFASLAPPPARRRSLDGRRRVG